MAEAAAAEELRLEQEATAATEVAAAEARAAAKLKAEEERAVGAPVAEAEAAKAQEEEEAAAAAEMHPRIEQIAATAAANCGAAEIASSEPSLTEEQQDEQNEVIRQQVEQQGCLTAASPPSALSFGNISFVGHSSDHSISLACGDGTFGQGEMIIDFSDPSFRKECFEWASLRNDLYAIKIYDTKGLQIDDLPTDTRKDPVVSSVAIVLGGHSFAKVVEGLALVD